MAKSCNNGKTNRGANANSQKPAQAGSFVLNPAEQALVDQYINGQLIPGSALELRAIDLLDEMRAFRVTQRKQNAQIHTASMARRNIANQHAANVMKAAKGNQKAIGQLSQGKTKSNKEKDLKKRLIRFFAALVLIAISAAISGFFQVQNEQTSQFGMINDVIGKPYDYSGMLKAAK